MISWPPKRKLAIVLRNVCGLCWLLCLIAATRFIGASEPVDGSKPGVELALFLGVFPFFFGAAALLQKRMAGAKTRDWIPVLFRGTPKSFSLLYRAYFFIAWCMCAYPMLLQFANKPEWPDFGINGQIMFVLVPSVFYLTCVGAYWSAAVESIESK